jgi:hypothetical protein
MSSVSMSTLALKLVYEALDSVHLTLEDDKRLGSGMDTDSDGDFWVVTGNKIALNYFHGSMQLDGRTLSVFAYCEDADVFCSKCLHAAKMCLLQGVVKHRFVLRKAVPRLSGKTFANAQNLMQAGTDAGRQIISENIGDMPNTLKSGYNQCLTFLFVLFEHRIRAVEGELEKRILAEELLEGLNSVTRVLRLFRDTNYAYEKLIALLNSENDIVGFQSLDIRTLPAFADRMEQLLVGIKQSTADKSRSIGTVCVTFFSGAVKLPLSHFNRSHEESQKALLWMVDVVLQSNNAPADPGPRTGVEWNCSEKYDRDMIVFHAGVRRDDNIVENGDDISYDVDEPVSKEKPVSRMKIAGEVFCFFAVVITEIVYEVVTIPVPYSLNRIIKDNLMGWMIEYDHFEREPWDYM